MKQFAQVSLPNVDINYKRLIFNSENHLINFIDYYSTIKSEEDLVQVVNTLESNGFESLLNQTKKLQYHNNGTINLIDGNIEDDKLIGDDRLAYLLNNKREIVVGSTLYKFDVNGVYYTSLINDNISSKVSSLKKQTNLLSKSMDKEVIYDLSNNLYLFSYDYSNGIEYQNTNSNSSSTDNNIQLLDVFDFETCNFDDDGFFESILPGSSEVCFDDINNTKRIRLKFSNQNYLLFSSTYAKLKSQKKNFFGFWNKDDFCDYLELGRTVVLKYPIEYPSPNSQTNTLLLKNNLTNSVTDSFGNIVTGSFNQTENVFDKFPFDSNSFDYEIYYYVGTSSPTSKEINKLISEAINGLISSLNSSHNSLFNPSATTNVAITIDTPDGIYLTEYGARTREYGVSKVERIYDPINFEIKASSTLENFFEDLINNLGTDSFLNAKNPEVIVLDVYGIGEYQGNTYGARIIKGGLTNENNNVIDSDGDGVPDTEDLCRFQAGYKKYKGCPYSLKDDGTLHTSRINNINDNLTVNGNIKNIGSYNKLQLKSSDYPLQSNYIKGGVYPKYNIIAGESISIKGNTNLSIKPEGITNTINLKILSTPNQFTTPISAKKSEEKKKGYAIKKLDYENTSSGKEIAIYPNPSSSVFYISTNSTITRYKVVNQIGKTVLVNRPSDNNFEIDVQKYPSGIYFIQLQFDDGKTEMKKLIKK